METRIADCPLGAKCEEVKTEAGRQILYRCPWYTQVQGKNPSTGEDTNEWGCAIAWMPMLLINAANESRKGVAATESFRNAVVEQNAVSQQIARLSLHKQKPLLQEKEICE